MKIGTYIAIVFLGRVLGIIYSIMMFTFGGGTAQEVACVSYIHFNK